MVIIKHKDTKKQSPFSLTEDTKSSKAAYNKAHKVFHSQGFVATFKSLVTFVSKENLCFFVSLCFKSTSETLIL